MGIQIPLPRPSPTGDGGLAHISKVISKIPFFLQLAYFGGICIPLMNSWGFPGGSVVKDLPAMQETQVQSLGWEDPLWRRKWQLTPVFLPGKSHGQRSLAGYSPWGCKRIGWDLATTQ